MTSDPIHRLRAAGTELSELNGPSPSFEDVVGRAPLASRRSPRLNVVVVLSALAISVVLFMGMGGAFRHENSPRVQAGSYTVRPGPVSSLPFGGATRTTLQEAEQTVDYPVILPAEGTPGLGNLKTVWVADDQTSEIEIDYDSGISLTLSPDVPPDPQALFQLLADDVGAAASVETVNGSPALVIVADWSTPCPNGKGGCTADELRNPGSVELIASGVTATLYGHVSTDVLLGIASTLASTPT